ncbi:MAG: OmpA family protein [Bacteroidetes bacterium]|nr:OmpA family protein [Bacteroidota bacterium]
MRKYILIVIFIASYFQLSAQTLFQSNEFTNRRIGFTNDASAVGWNPAMLGMSDNTDLVLGLPLNASFKTNGLYGAFIKMSGMGLGFIPQKDSISKQQFFVGLGFSLLDERLWFGGSIRPTGDFGSAFSNGNLRYNISAIYSIKQALVVSAGVNTIHSAPTPELSYDLSAAYSPFQWLTLHSSLSLSAEKIFNGYSTSSSVGTSIGLFDNYVVLSYNFLPELNTSRLGMELSLSSGTTIGSINSFASDYNGSVMFIRTHTSDELSFGDRAGSPGYRKYTGAVKDAGCTPWAIKWAAGNSDSPRDILNIMNLSSHSEYGELASEISAFSSNPIAAFDSIQKKYYSKYAPKSTLSGREQTTIATKSITQKVLLIDAESIQKQTSATFFVRDELGRTVSGLTKANFVINDTNQSIVSLTQTTSKTVLPVDIVLLVDCSGSMSGEIQSVRRNVNNFVQSLATRGVDYRVGCILYGEKIYATLEPTASVKDFEEFFLQAAATGRDEITSTAIHEATLLPFRPNAQRIFVLITDDCSIQDNGEFYEPSLTREMWNAGAKLYSVINPANHNGGIMTRLTFGRDYDIKKPFTTILDDISGDITTTYQMVYRENPPKEKIIEKITVLKGKVTDDDGSKLAANLTFRPNITGNEIKLIANNFTGEYETNITEGKIYEATVLHNGYVPLNDKIDLTTARKGDTITHNFLLHAQPTILFGKITDQNGAPQAGKIKIEDAVTLEAITTLKTNEKGEYSIEIKEGREYRLTPSVPDYVASNAEVDMRSTKRGEKIQRDLSVTAITIAIEQGLTFKLKNIFFDSGKWDLRPESEPELEKLYAFMEENKSVRVEVGAHTDAIGKDEANKILAGKRAESVVTFLAKKGIAQTRLIAIGYGESKPVATNDTEEGRALNRRVEIKLVK